jgi:dihydropteroate synthase
MGILNATPDSFSDGGRYLQPSDAVQHGLRMVADGADLLDLGGESTRPGHTPVPAEEQLRRILPVLAELRAQTDVPISVDTTRASVADAVVRAGADWINDTTALRGDPDMARVIAAHGCPVILMHRFVPPRTTADPPPSRSSVMGRIVDELARRIADAVAAGIPEARILLDPGIGFGTLMADNLVIHAHIGDLQRLGRPVVAGPSRKSFLGHLTGRSTGDRLAGTAASVAALALRGVDILRVHDVPEMRDVISVTDAIRRAAQD